jgi:hypothetical protein
VALLLLSPPVRGATGPLPAHLRPVLPPPVRWLLPRRLVAGVPATAAAAGRAVPAAVAAAAAAAAAPHVGGVEDGAEQPHDPSQVVRLQQRGALGRLPGRFRPQYFVTRTGVT